MLSAKKTEHFRQLLETRIAESERILANAEQEVRASSARHADSTFWINMENEGPISSRPTTVSLSPS